VVDEEQYVQYFHTLTDMITKTLQLSTEPWVRGSLTDSRIVTLENLNATFDQLYNMAVHTHLTVENLKVRLRCRVTFRDLKTFDFSEDNWHSGNRRVELYSHYCQDCPNKKLTFVTHVE
jgi:hypothetical protein